MGKLIGCLWFLGSVIALVAGAGLAWGPGGALLMLGALGLWGLLSWLS